ncbi:SDR family NAD(P)-dependent oxidoreductase [Methylobacterium sp. WL64]|nr:SDR family NAD(P)-dependent oxidoreductase [Methylobacterium sp. WL64]
MSNPWTTDDIPDQTGKRAIVTGANSGIGWHTALELARAGAEVTIASRDTGKANVATERIRAALPSARVRTGVLDLARLASVRAFVEAELTDARPIDLLVNNAGVMALPERRVSPDGHELQFATNVLGPFVLTGLLMPRILEAGAPRVVTVSSYAHTQGGPTPIEDLESERAYRPVRAYSKTKLANILFTRELQRRTGDRLLAVTCHPGASRTNLSADTSRPMKLITWTMGPMLQSAAAGAEPTLRAATAPDAKPGAYYGPGGLFRLRGPAVEAETAPFAHDAVAARRLWSELERISGVVYPIP